MPEDLIRQFTDNYDRFLRDESSEEGSAADIAFPETEGEAAEVMRILAERGKDNITIQGALTGIRGEGVPHGGCIINLSRMNKVIDSCHADGVPYITVQPGATLQDLEIGIARRFRGENLFWPPKPSEDTATIGGIVSTGAFGMNAAGYGETCEHVASLSFAGTDGDIHRIEGSKDISAFLESDDRSGLITSLTLRLTARPDSLWGIAFFFGSPDEAISFADSLRKLSPEDGTRIVSMELMRQSAIEMALTIRETPGNSWTVPELPDEITDIVYIEVEGSEEAIEEQVMELAELAAEYGSDADSAWALSGETETGKIHSLRHAVTEASAQVMAGIHAGDPGIHLIAADVHMDDGEPLRAVIGRYERDIAAAGLRSAVCCSIGIPMLRIILIPENTEEFNMGQKLAAGWKSAVQPGEEI